MKEGFGVAAQKNQNYHSIAPRIYKSFAVFLLVGAISSQVHAVGSFRIHTGKVISAGLTLSQLYRIAGVPIFAEVLSMPDNSAGKKRELFIYELNGAVGGLYDVAVELENATVVSVTAKQVGRI